MNATLYNLTLRAECMTVECVYRSICTQMGRWVINTGISVIAIYILTGWLLWLWWNHIYPRIDWDAFYGRHPNLWRHPYDLREFKAKVYWDMFVRDKASKLLLGYAAIVLYFALAK